jgi:threonine/homoserine/homoserine lactone efflux protein
MLAGPAWWSNQVGRRRTEPLIQFLFMQAILLCGLTLLMGPSSQGSWLWIFVGAIFIALALGLLGMPVSMRGRFLDRWSRSPVWANRLAGMTLVILALLLVIDTWRGGP